MKKKGNGRTPGQQVALDVGCAAPAATEPAKTKPYGKSLLVLPALSGLSLDEEDECHNLHIPCCRLIREVALDVFPERAAEMFAANEMAVMSVVTYTPSLLGVLLRNYLLEQQQSLPAPPPALKKKRKRKKKKENDQVEVASNSSSLETLPPLQPPSSAADVSTSTPSPLPAPVDNVGLWLHRSLRDSGNDNVSTISYDLKNRDLTSFVEYLSQRRQQERERQQHASLKTPLPRKIVPNRFDGNTPNIAIAHVRTACDSISCPACQQSAQSYLCSMLVNHTSTNVPGSVISDDHPSPERPPLVLGPSSISIPTMSPWSVPAVGDEWEVDRAFDYVAMEEGTQGDSNVEMNTASFRLEWKTQPSRNLEPALRVVMDETNTENGSVLTIQHVQGWMRNLLLACALPAIDSPHAYILSDEEFTDIQTRTTKAVTELRNQLTEIGQDQKLLRTRLDDTAAATTVQSSFDVKTSTTLRDCDVGCDKSMDQLLQVLVQVTKQYHSFLSFGGDAQDAPLEQSMDALWRSYHVAVAAMLQSALAHEGRLLQLATRPGVVPQLFLNASHRSSYRTLLMDKFRAVQECQVQMSSILLQQRAPATKCSESSSSGPSLVRTLHAYQAFHNLVAQGVNDNNGGRKSPLDEMCMELLRAYQELTHTVHGGSVNDILQTQETRCEKITQLVSQMDQQLVVDESAQGEFRNSQGTVQWRELRVEYEDLLLCQTNHSEGLTADYEFAQENHPQAESLLRRRENLERLTANVVLQWRCIKRWQPASNDSVSPPLKLTQWLRNEVTEAELAGKKNASDECQGGGGKRRISSIILGLLYQWFVDRCKEWDAELIRNEILQNIDESFGLDKADANSVVPSAKGTKKSKKKKEKRVVAASVKAIPFTESETKEEIATEAAGTIEPGALVHEFENDDTSLHADNEKNISLDAIEAAEPVAVEDDHSNNLESERMALLHPIGTSELDTAATEPVASATPASVANAQSSSPLPSESNHSSPMIAKPNQDTSLSLASAMWHDIPVEVGVFSSTGFQSAEGYLVGRVAAMLKANQQDNGPSLVYL